MTQETMRFWNAVASAGQYAPCSRQITTPTSHHSTFTGRMLFLTPNQQCQSTEGTVSLHRLNNTTLNDMSRNTALRDQSPSKREKLRIPQKDDLLINLVLLPANL